MDTVVVCTCGENPANGGRDPHEEHEEGVDVLRETPHGVGVHSQDVREGSGGSVFVGRSVPELVVVVLEPEESEGDGGSSEHGPGSELGFIPGLHSVSGIETGGLGVDRLLFNSCCGRSNGGFSSSDS